MIDAHIHLDLYEDDEIASLMASLGECTGLVSVSFHLKSCMKNLQLAIDYHKVKPAFGFHPEQELPADEEKQDLLAWIVDHKEEMVAVGEVGLPYYLRAESASSFQLEGYVELLEEFIKLAKQLDKPIVLHAVYDDAPIVCDLLEKYNVKEAHFHWFKGDHQTVERMIANGYYISVTPDVVYEREIQQLVKTYPLEQMMVETDGPWRFEGVFEGKMTHPRMMHESIAAIAGIKNSEQKPIYKQLYENTKRFYNLYMF